jgi:hypothetical protein
MNCRFLVNNGDAEAEARHLPFLFRELGGSGAATNGTSTDCPGRESSALRPIDNAGDAAPDCFLLPEGEQGSLTARGTDNGYQL